MEMEKLMEMEMDRDTERKTVRVVRTERERRVESGFQFSLEKI